MRDLCPQTPLGETAVDSDGCSEGKQLLTDDDMDNVCRAIRPLSRYLA